jgi:opine dehydrogenase
VGCKIYHDLGRAYGVPTPIIDAMIVIGGAFHQRDLLADSRYSLEYLGIAGMDKAMLNAYLREGAL